MDPIFPGSPLGAEETSGFAGFRWVEIGNPSALSILVCFAPQVRSAKFTFLRSAQVEQAAERAAKLPVEAILILRDGRSRLGPTDQVLRVAGRPGDCGRLIFPREIDASAEGLPFGESPRRSGMGGCAMAAFSISHMRT